MFEANGIFVYSEATAYELLESLGMDSMDVQDFKNMLCSDEVDEAEYRADIAKQEFEAMESYTEHVQSILNEVMNIVDEALNMERISKPRERFEAIKNLIEKEL